MTDIAMVYQMLNWKAPSAIQAQGKELARKVKDLSLLIHPPRRTLCLGTMCGDPFRKNRHSARAILNGVVTVAARSELARCGDYC